MEVKKLILSNTDLQRYIDDKKIVVEPFLPSIVQQNGLDLRLSGEIARLRISDQILDTSYSYSDEHLRSDFYLAEKGSSFVIDPGEHVLASTLERLSMPSDIMGICELRSTYARIGLSIPPTIIDAGFQGHLTIEIIGGSFPVRVYSGHGFLHVILCRLTSPVTKPYAGKYSGQRGVTFPKLPI